MLKKFTINVYIPNVCSFNLLKIIQEMIKFKHFRKKANPASASTFEATGIPEGKWKAQGAKLCRVFATGNIPRWNVKYDHWHLKMNILEFSVLFLITLRLLTDI